MKNLKLNAARAILTACAIDTILTVLAIFWVTIQDKPSDLAVIVLTLCILPLLPLIIVSAAILLRALADRKPKTPNFERGPAARTLALLITAGLIASYVLLDKSLWAEPSDNRYIYENTAIALSLGALFLTAVLNAVQTEIYWFTSRAAKALDERQQIERRRVFETSYKLLAVLFVLSAYNLVSYARDAEALTAINFARFPESLSWLAFNVIVAVVAMPLLVAAFRRK